MAGKRLTTLEMPEEDMETILPSMVASSVQSVDVVPPQVTQIKTPQSIPLPPIPAAPVRRVMIQLSIKAPVELVERLETMASQTRAQKQAVIAAALDAYMRGHGY